MFNTYTDEQILILQKKINTDLLLTVDNIKLKILELPIIFNKYKKIFMTQKKLLQEINVAIKKKKKVKYHYYKFNYDFQLNSASEINMYVEGDDELCELYVLYDKQENIVNLLSDTLTQITKMSFLIKSYVDLEKLRVGIIE